VTVYGVVRVDIDRGTDVVDDRRVGKTTAGIKSVSHPLVVSKHIGVQTINWQIGDGHDHESPKTSSA
jgi:hypothetical protein